MRGRVPIGVLVLALALGMALLLRTQMSPVAGQSDAAQATSNPAGPGAPSGSIVGGTRTSDAGGVTFRVTWQGPEAGPVFAVAMDTHSVPLDGYDLRELAVLRTDEGVVVQPTDWDAPKGGHHRSGTLSFPATTTDGAPIIGPSTKSLELTVRGVAGVAERKLQWDLPS